MDPTWPIARPADSMFYWYDIHRFSTDSLMYHIQLLVDCPTSVPARMHCHHTVSVERWSTTMQWMESAAGTFPIENKLIKYSSFSLRFQNEPLCATALLMVYVCSWLLNTSTAFLKANESPNEKGSGTSNFSFTLVETEQTSENKTFHIVGWDRERAHLYLRTG